jgi:hypothetical protein
VKIYDLKISDIKHAILGMRAAHQSYDKSDSDFDTNIVGNEDYKLMSKLIKAGNSHRKFLRCINFSFICDMPLYWWKQFDQYKVGVTTLSESTMHNITDRYLTVDDFEGHLSYHLSNIIDILNNKIDLYKDYNTNYDKEYRKEIFNEIISLLPQSYIQKRFVSMNFEVMYRIIKDRSMHKLDEWQFFINSILQSNNLFGILKEGI